MEKQKIPITTLSMSENIPDIVYKWLINRRILVENNLNKYLSVMKNLKENHNWMDTDIDLSRSETELCSNAFYGNKTVEKVILPDYADIVPANMFKGCINLKEVTLPMDPDIGESAFEGCISLTDIHISFYVGSIATNAFRGCRENIRFHADSPVINPERLKQHIEKELGHSIELYDISGNLVVSTD